MNVCGVHSFISLISKILAMHTRCAGMMLLRTPKRDEKQIMSLEPTWS